MIGTEKCRMNRIDMDEADLLEASEVEKKCVSSLYFRMHPFFSGCYIVF